MWRQLGSLYVLTIPALVLVAGTPSAWAHNASLNAGAGADPGCFHRGEEPGRIRVALGAQEPWDAIDLPTLGVVREKSGAFDEFAQSAGDKIAQRTGGTTVNGSVGDKLLFAFSKPDAGAPWSAVNDNVMGGVSRGSLHLTDHGTAVFSGEISLENNGGFSSVRSRTGTYDLGRFKGITIRCLGDGKRYKLFLRTDTRSDGVMYQASFDAPRDEWSELSLPFPDFIPTYRGSVVASAGPLDPSRIRSFGLLIADGQAGPFRLEIEGAKAEAAR